MFKMFFFNFKDLVVRNLLLVGFCFFFRVQYDEDFYWWFYYFRSQQFIYYDFYDFYFYEFYEFYFYGVEEGLVYVYGFLFLLEFCDCFQECDCLFNFFIVMYCDNRNFKYLFFVFFRMKYVYFQNNQIFFIQEGVFDNAIGLFWIVFYGNQIISDKVGRKVFFKLKYLERLYLDYNNLIRVFGLLFRFLREFYFDYNQILRVFNNVLEGLENFIVLYF